MSPNPMPTITPAQIAALLTFIAAQVVAWGWITNDTGQRIVSVGGTLVAVAWKLADAYLRAQRAKAVAVNPSIIPPPAKRAV